MTTAGYALSALLAVLLLISLTVVLRVLLDALALFHQAGLARIRRSTR